MSDNFEDAIASFSAKLEADEEAVFLAVVADTEASIRVGSPVTGAAGQPVGQYGPGYHPGKIGGTLRNSYQTEFIGDREAVISSNLPYALPIEEGIGKHGPLKLRSTVGGFHSIKATAAAFQRLVDEVVRRFNRG